MDTIRDVSFRIQRGVFNEGYNCWLLRWDRDRPLQHISKDIITAVTFEPLKEGERFPTEPTFKMRDDEMQMLMDEMWRNGIRPTEVGTAGQLDAMKYHLEDMRKLVFK